MKLVARPAALLKLAPVFVMAFVFPLLFLPMLYPPQDPVSVKAVPAREEGKSAGRDGAAAGRGRGVASSADGEKKDGKRGGSGGGSKKTQ